MRTFDSYDNITTFEIPFSETTFPVNQFVSTIHSNSASQDEMTDILLPVYKRLNNIDIRAGYIHLRDNILVQNSYFIIGNIIFQCGNDISHGLKGSENAYLFACSCSDELHKIANASFANDNYLEGFLIDSLGSYIVEKTADDISSTIAQIVKGKSGKTTARYSPGYCGWDVAEQAKLFSLYPSNFCGISLNQDFLMNPIKSVNGIIGYGTESNNVKYNCELCKKVSCVLSRTNKTEIKTPTLL